MVAEPDYYKVLQVARDASEKQIKEAYHRVARERHPDKGVTLDEIQRLQQEFALVSAAYNVLKDKDRRAEYDARLQKDEATRAQTGEQPATSGTAAASAMTATKVASLRDRVAIAKRAYAKGVQMLEANDFARAAEFFDAAVKNDDANAEYQVKLGLALMRAHQSLNRAVSAIQRAIELDPYKAEHRLALGEVYETIGSTSLAIKAYQDILKWDPTNANALERLEGLGVGGGGSLLSRILGKLKKR